MNVLRHITASGHIRQRWKNGGGTTTELARADDGDRWLWRLSVADVDSSGPFSDFTGYRRIIALLEGNGMALSFDRAPPVVIERRYEPFAFDGGLRTDCRLLDGPVRDFNVIVDDSRMHASLEFHAHYFDIAVDGIVLLHALRGRWQVNGDERGCTLPPGDTLHVENAGALSFAALDADALLAVARLTPRRIIPDNDDSTKLPLRRDAP